MLAQPLPSGPSAPTTPDSHAGYIDHEEARAVEVGQHAHAPDLPKLEKYRRPQAWRSLWQLSSTVGGFIGLWAAMYWGVFHAWWLTLLLLLPAAGLLVRLFILQHDCGHGSFFKSRWANDLVGRMLTIFTMTPYHQWRKHHAIHHATSGDLDRRGYGDIHMLTVREYNERTPWQKLVYRIYRHPLVLFGIAPVFYFGVYQRLMLEPPSWKKERSSVFWTNIVMAAGLVALWWFVGFTGILLVHLPICMVGASAGIWLFYVQHQFKPSYWERNEEWDYFDAGIHGSSYYQLPKILQWFTANIGLHHIHHVDSRIPNYRLQECYNENPQFQKVYHLKLWESLSCASIKLWDEDKGEMVVGFPKQKAKAADAVAEEPCSTGASAES